MADDSSEIIKEQSESVAATNLKVLGDGPAFFQNQSFALAVNSAAGWNNINQAVVSKAAESLIATSPAEGASDSAMAGILTKMMQTVPPVTSGQNVANQG